MSGETIAVSIKEALRQTAYWKWLEQTQAEIQEVGAPQNPEIPTETPPSAIVALIGDGEVGLDGFVKKVRKEEIQSPVVAVSQACIRTRYAFREYDMLFNKPVSRGQLVRGIQTAKMRADQYSDGVCKVHTLSVKVAALCHEEPQSKLKTHSGYKKTVGKYNEVLDSLNIDELTKGERRVVSQAQNRIEIEKKRVA